MGDFCVKILKVKFKIKVQFSFLVFTTIRTPSSNLLDGKLRGSGSCSKSYSYLEAAVQLEMEVSIFNSLALLIE